MNVSKREKWAKDMEHIHAIESLKNKRILILGLGREGQTSAQFLLDHLDEINPSEIGLADQKKSALDADVFQKLKAVRPDTKEHIVEDFLPTLSAYDVVLKSPGIAFPNEKRAAEDMTQILSAAQTKITGQIDLFLEEYAQQVIGVTGTKGKSTTTSLVYCLLSQHPNGAKLLGNIGIPAFTQMGQLGKQFAALELSCHQLEFTRHTPHIAILTNIYPEHLDHYASYEHYVKAKLHIAKNQGSGDFFFLRTDDEKQLEDLAKWTDQFKDFKAAFVLFSMRPEAFEANYLDQFGLTHERIEAKAWLQHSGELKIEWLRGQVHQEAGHAPKPLPCELDFSQYKQLVGLTQKMNASMAALAAILCGLNETQIAQGLTQFQPLPHRFQYVGQHAGIDFYNDSIATIPQAVELALKHCDHRETLIIGGQDRGIDYSLFEKIVRMDHLQHVIALPEAGWRVLKELQLSLSLDISQFELEDAGEGHVTLAQTKAPTQNFSQSIQAGTMLSSSEMSLRLYAVKDMKDAVALAYHLTKKGRACILSPAAPSYNMYRDFEERGEHFMSLVKSLDNKRQRILFVGNPNAGRSMTEKELGAIAFSLTEKGDLATFHLTRYAGELSDLIAQHQDQYDVFVCYGGDGTVREMGSVMQELNCDKPVVYIPGGSTCDYARSLGLSFDPSEAASLALSQNAPTIHPDLGLCNGQKFIYVASFGAFTETSWQTPHELKKNLGPIAYLIEGLKQIGRITPYHAVIEIDGEAYEGDFIFGAVMNSLSVGGVLHLDEQLVRLDDGLFEILLVKQPSNPLKIPGLIAKLLAGDYQHEDILLLSAQKVHMHFDEAVSFTLDGDFGGIERNWDIQILHRCFQLRIPKCDTQVESGKNETNLSQPSAEH